MDCALSLSVDGDKTTEKFEGYEKGCKIFLQIFEAQYIFTRYYESCNKIFLTKFKLRFSRVFRALKYCPASTVHFPLTEHPFLSIFFQNEYIPLKSRLRIPLSYTSEQNDTRI